MTPDTPAPDVGDERVDRLILDYLTAVDAGREPDRAALLAGHPDLADELRAFFADQDHVARAARAARTPVNALDKTPGADGADGEAVPETVGGYRLLRVLGEGGMGRVYEAEDASGERVAVKLLAPGVAGSATALERFRQEGRLASRIAHPRCVFVRTADEDAGRPYIVMELMSGATLKDLVEAGGPLEPADAVAKILDIIEGLEEAHRAGVLHRDVKPANCYLGADGRAKVGDFGLSRSLVAGAMLTRPGGFVGTPLFASPEQLKGEPLDERTDVYSVAATLYYLLTGRAPFQHPDGAAVIARVVSEPAPPPRALRPEIPPALEEAVLRALERSRERRPASLAALRETLLPFVPGQMTFAGLGLRVGALLLDTLPFTVVGEVVGLLLLGTRLYLSLPFFLAMLLPLFLYFFLFEWSWGYTPGKGLLGLRVTRASGWERPGPAAVFWRTLVFMATGGAVTNLLLPLVLGPDDVLAWSLLSVAGSLLSLMVRFSTMRPGNGYRCLHEIVSGTRVVQLAPSARRGAAPTAPTPPALVSLPTGEMLPARLGPFRIAGALRWDDAGRVLLGEDAALGRRVWVCLRPVKSPPLAPARKALGRPARLRWLASGADGDWAWDAFVAPAGEPLAGRVTAHGPLDWAEARPLLEQLVEELQAAEADETLPARLAVEQVWSQRGGRAELLDAPLAPPAQEDESALSLLRRTATLALEGKARAAGDERRPVRAVLPLHARRVLDRLVGHRDGYRSLDEVARDFADTRRRPAEVTAPLRAFHLALSLCFVSCGLVAMLAWSRNAAIAHIILLDHEMVRAQVLLEILDRPEMATELRGRLPVADPLSADPEGQRLLLERRRTHDWREHEARRVSLAWHESFARVAPPLRLRLSTGAGRESLRVERLPGDEFHVRAERLGLPVGEPLVLTAGDLSESAARARGDTDATARGRFRSLTLLCIAVLAFFPATLTLSAFAWRGGLALRLAGLALVRRSGRDALRLQAAWRAALVWAPVLAALAPIAWIDTERLDLLWLCPVLQGLALLILVAHAALAVRFPRRALPDWLSGTYLVPR